MSVAMRQILPMTYGLATRRNALRWRRWVPCVAWLSVFAVALPSLGPLPLLVRAVDDHSHFAAGYAISGDGGHDGCPDASSIPGSPTHPADHHCAQCLVLKHLSRCILATPTVVVAPPVVTAFVAQRVLVAVAPSAEVAGNLPPARAPPPPIV